MKNILEYFKDLFPKKKSSNDIKIADPFYRFFAFLIDSFIIYSLLAIFIFINIKKDLIPEIGKNNEISFEINFKNEITNLESIENKDNVLSVVLNEKKQENFNKLVYKKIYNNKFNRYIIFLLPIIYNILYLLTKKRATIGQQIFGLMIIKIDGSELTVNDIINRVFLFSFCKILILMPFTIILPIFKTKNKTTLYDYLTKTCVIKL